MTQRTHRRGYEAENTEGNMTQRTHRRGCEAENTQKGT
jgi:hypothetical protein